MAAQEISVLRGLAIDSKGLRGSGRTDNRPLHLLSGISHRLRLTAQEPMEEKCNEIPALEPRLRKVSKGTLECDMISACALNCQEESAGLSRRN